MDDFPVNTSAAANHGFVTILRRALGRILISTVSANPQAVVRQTSHITGLKNVSVHMANLFIRKCLTFMDGVSIVSALITICMDSDTEKPSDSGLLVLFSFFCCIINLKKGD